MCTISSELLCHTRISRSVIAGWSRTGKRITYLIDGSECVRNSPGKSFRQIDDLIWCRCAGWAHKLSPSSPPAGPLYTQRDTIDVQKDIFTDSQPHPAPACAAATTDTARVPAGGRGGLRFSSAGERAALSWQPGRRHISIANIDGHHCV